MPRPIGDELTKEITKRILEKCKMRFSEGGIVPGQVCQEQELYRANQKKLMEKKKAEAFDEMEAIFNKLNKTKKDTGFDEAIAAAFNRNSESILDLLNVLPFQKVEKKIREDVLEQNPFVRFADALERMRKIWAEKERAEDARERFISGLGWRNRPNVIGQFIYNKERERIGVLVAYKASRGRVGTGWSLCSKKDKFSITEGIRIAYDRMFNIDEGGILPSSISKTLDAFDIRAEKFFESNPVYLKSHEKNWNKFFNSLPEGIKEEMRIDYKERAKEREALKKKEETLKKKEVAPDVVRFRAFEGSLGRLEFYNPITEKEAEYMSHFEVTVKTIKKK